MLEKKIVEIQESESQIRELVKLSCSLSNVPADGWIKLCQSIESDRILALMSDEQV